MAPKPKENIEIERQFILSAVPDEIKNLPGVLITQGYFLPKAVPECEMRVRQKGDKYFLTIKGSGLMSRKETEIELSKEQFIPLWALTEGRRIEKTRRVITVNGTLIEVDEHRGKLAGLIVAEVEFKDLEAAKSFTPPPWFGEEVTEYSELKNGNLSRFGLPARFRHLLSAR